MPHLPVVVEFQRRLQLLTLCVPWGLTYWCYYIVLQFNWFLICVCFTTETNQRWKLDRLVVVPLLFSSCCRATQTTLFLSTNFDVYITVYIFGSCRSDAFRYFVMFWIWLFQLEIGVRIIHFIRLFYFFESVCTYVILIIVF